MARYRARWKKYQINIDPKRLVFIDESPAFAGAGFGRRQTWRRSEVGSRAANA